MATQPPRAQVAPSALATVEFHGQPLLTFLHNGEPYAAMKPIVEGMGLQWAAQEKRIKRNPILSTCMSVMDIVAADGKTREMVALPLKLLNGWLFGVDVNRVKPDLRETILAYQRECYDALYRHWHREPAAPPAPRKSLPKPYGLPWPRWYYCFEADAFGIKGDPFEAGKVLARCHLLRLRREAAVPGCPPNSRALLFNGFLRRIEQLGGIPAFLACKEGGEMYALNRLIGGFFWELDARAQRSAIDMPGLDGAEAEWRGIAEART